MSRPIETSPIRQIALMISLLIGGLLLNLLLSFIGVIPFAGLSGFTEVMSNPSANVGLLKALQTLQSICLFIIPAYFFAKIISQKPKSYFKLDKTLQIRTTLIISITMMAAIPFINLLGEWNSKMVLPEALSGLEALMKMAEEKAADVTILLVSGKSISSLLINLIMIAVLPAIGEELIFRGILQRILVNSTRNVHVAVWISAFIFSAFHMQFYGFLPRFFIGAILGYLYVASGSLWLPILAHFINNAMVTVFYFLYNKGMVTEDLDTLGTGEGWLIGALSGGILLIIYFYVERNKTELQLDELK